MKEVALLLPKPVGNALHRAWRRGHVDGLDGTTLPLGQMPAEFPISTTLLILIGPNLKEDVPVAVTVEEIRP